MKVLFVRHGESVDDLEDRYGGWADYNLTENGKLQTNEAVERISSLGTNFDIVVTSPLKRAFQTAEIIAKQLDLQLVTLEYLKERNLNGILTGLTRAEAKAKYPKQVEAHNNWEYVDGSERIEDFNKRVKNACDHLLGMKYNSIIAVTHGLLMKTFFKELLDIDITKVGDGAFGLVELNNYKIKLMDLHGLELKKYTNL